MRQSERSRKTEKIPENLVDADGFFVIEVSMNVL